MFIEEKKGCFLPCFTCDSNCIYRHHPKLAFAFLKWSQMWVLRITKRALKHLSNVAYAPHFTLVLLRCTWWTGGGGWGHEATHLHIIFTYAGISIQLCPYYIRKSGGRLCWAWAGGCVFSTFLNWVNSSLAGWFAGWCCYTAFSWRS